MSWNPENKIYGWDAVKLHDAYTQAELVGLLQWLADQPENQISEEERDRLNTIHLYTKKARKKMDAVDWAIRYHMQDRHRERA